MGLNLGYGLAQGLAGAAQGVGMLADQQLKQNADDIAANRQLDLYTRQKAVDEMMNQRAAEYKQNIAAKRAGQINDMATGMLEANKPSEPVANFTGGVEGDSGDTQPATTTAGAPPPSILDRIRANRDAARLIGATDEADRYDKDMQQETQNKRFDNQDKNTEEKNRIQDDYKKNLDKRMDALSEFQASTGLAKETIANTREARAATSKALDGVNAAIRALEKEVADPMLAPAQKDVMTTQLAAARTEAKGYRNLLGGAGILQGTPDKAPPPLDPTSAKYGNDGDPKVVPKPIATPDAVATPTNLPSPGNARSNNELKTIIVADKEQQASVDQDLISLDKKISDARSNGMRDTYINGLRQQYFELKRSRYGI